MASRVSTILVLALAACGRGQPDTHPPESEAAATEPAVSAGDISVSPERMKATIEHLASDELRGRFTRSPSDLGAAADYVADVYRKVSLPPVGDDYRVPFELEVGTQPGPDLHVWLETPEEILDVPTDAYASLANGGGQAVYGIPIFVGTETPPGIAGRIVVATLDEAPATALVKKRVAKLEAAGAGAVVIVAPSRPTTTDRIKAAIPVALTTRDTADLALPLDGAQVGAEMEGIKLSFAADTVPIYEPSFNVLAWIEGSEHPEEIVMLGAHLDHIGTSEFGSYCRPSEGDEICNGADDNASGSAMVLEIARSIAESGFHPKRSLVFAHFAGEELGLLGSSWLADHPPDAAPFTEGHIVAMINLDMVGRYRPDEGLQVGGVSSSDQWRPLIEEAGDQGLNILYERSVSGRSDHASFYRKKIPVLFFFTGLHGDYHRVGDSADKINIAGMASIAEIVMHVTTSVADGTRVVWSDPRSEAEGEVSRLPGSDPSTLEK